MRFLRIGNEYTNFLQYENIEKTVFGTYSNATQRHIINIL